MSNNITKTIQESLEFAKKIKMFPENEASDLIKYDLYGTEDIKSHLLQSQIRLIDSIIKEMDCQMFVDSSQAGQFSMHSDGYNQALEDQISSLNETLEELKKSL